MQHISLQVARKSFEEIALITRSQAPELVRYAHRQGERILSLPEMAEWQETVAFWGAFWRLMACFNAQWAEHEAIKALRVVDDAGVFTVFDLSEEWRGFIKEQTRNPLIFIHLMHQISLMKSSKKGGKKKPKGGKKY